MAPLRISLLALPETTPSIIYGLHEVLSAVGVAWAEMTGERSDVPPFDVSIVARDAVPFPSPLGPPIVPQANLDDCGAPDVIVATDLLLPQRASPHGRWRTEAAWIRDRFAEGAVVCSVCTGSIFLAESGLLDGWDATTHWGAADVFTRHYPRVTLRPARILCPSGPEHRIVTSGGAGSWADLALYLIARFSSPAEAARIAKIFLIGDRSDGQLPFAGMRRERHANDAVIGRCQEWLADHYMEPNPVARMTALSGLPERTFKRRFRAATGYAPIDYVQSLRIEEAKQLLETTGDATEAVAQAVGYEETAHFRRLFKRLTGVTPAAYRRRYRFIGVAGPIERTGAGDRPISG